MSSQIAQALYERLKREAEAAGYFLTRTGDSSSASWKGSLATRSGMGTRPVPGPLVDPVHIGATTRLAKGLSNPICAHRLIPTPSP